MISPIAVLFIIFLLLLTTFFVWAIKSKYGKTQENFTTPTALNAPVGTNLEGKDFLVGNRYPMRPDPPIVAQNAKVEFRKPQWLYDGIWGEKCELDGEGFERCNWENTSAYYPLDKKGFSYGADKFFHGPAKRMAIGEQIVSPPDCPANAPMNDSGITYQEAYEQNPPIYLAKPTLEDIYGFNPLVQDNNLYQYPPVVIGTL